jgi:hypothetical protein
MPTTAPQAHQTVSSKAARASLHIDLGESHDGFIGWCSQRGTTPAAVVKGFVREALAGEVPPGQLTRAKARPVRRKDIHITLGPQRKAFDAWCAGNGLRPGTAVRRYIEALVSAGGHSSPMAPTTPMALPALQLSEQLGEVDLVRVRVEIKLLQSEYDALRALALERGDKSPQTMIRAVLRAFLTQSPNFSGEEVAALGASNLQLLKLANNVNQIARHLNDKPGGAGQVSEAVTGDMAAAVVAIREHVALAAGMLGKSRERWVLKGGPGREH